MALVVANERWVTTIRRAERLQNVYPGIARLERNVAIV
jgi:hypothetical protein